MSPGMRNQGEGGVVRRFYLHARHHGILYAELVDPSTGQKLTARSTGTTSRDDALMIVADWLREGIPMGRLRHPRPAEVAFSLDAILKAIRKTDLLAEDALCIIGALKDKGLVEGNFTKAGPGSVLFEDFLLTFWNFKESPYVLERIRHGHRIGARHCYENERRVKHHWIGVFPGKRLAEITKAELKRFALALAEPEKELSASTVNRIMVAGTTALRWAFENELIPANPAEGLERFAENPAKRGILSSDEAAALFRLTWADERARVGSLVAASTGLRAGEVLALRLKDVGEDRLFIRHNWSDRDGGLKSPKNGDEREVPLIPSVRAALMKLADSSPHSHDPDQFIFYGMLAHRPMDFHFLLDGLTEALVSLSVSDEGDGEKREDARVAWKARRVTFHSWRHFYAARMSDRLDPDKVQRITGHRDREVFTRYAAHVAESEFKAIGVVTDEVFGSVLEAKE